MSANKVPQGAQKGNHPPVTPTAKKNAGTRKSLHISQVEATFNKYYPALLPALKVALAVCIGLVFKDKSKPVSLILENPSGRGKSTIVEAFFPRSDEMKVHVHRVDAFTPKAFVTSAANMTEKQREKVDLLPKLEDKYLLTKELAPIFRGQEKDLMEMFKVLIPVLDGKGHVTNTGLASRGYDRSIVFNWLGATTPLPRRAFKQMSQLGTRLLFYETPVVDFDEEDLIAYAERDDISTAETECNQAVNDFVVNFFKRTPPRSLDFSSIAIHDQHLERIVKLANFLVKTRAEVIYERVGGNWTPVGVNPSEGPHKVINYLKEIARAHALIHERTQINDDDLSQIKHIVISSTPSHIRPLIWELADKGQLDTKRGVELCQVSDTTISERYSLELDLLGVIEIPIQCAGTLCVYKLKTSLGWLLK
jgi:hypothetical protein